MLRPPSNGTSLTFFTEVPPPAEALPPPDLNSNNPAQIVSHLLTILRRTDLTEDARDLALVQLIQARDYHTDLLGGKTRNTMTLRQAREVEMLQHGGSQVREDLQGLIRGRNYIAIAHGVGPDAKVTLLLNRPDCFSRKIVVFEDSGTEVDLFAGIASRLFGSPDDRLILGPHVCYATHPISAGPLYHEVQSGMDSGLHAINALAGEQLISKAGYQHHMLQRLLDTHSASSATHDDFYRNSPDNPELAALFDLDNGIQPDVLTQLMRSRLPGEVECSPSSLNDKGLLDLAQDWQAKKNGVIILNQGHYVAFKKAFNSRIREMQWVLVNSANTKQKLITPLEFLQRQADPGGVVLIGWIAPHKTSKHRWCCTVQ